MRVCVCVCVCVSVLRQKRKDGKFTVTHTYSDTLCDMNTPYWHAVTYPGILFGGGFQQIQLRTEDRENGDLGAAAP